MRNRSNKLIKLEKNRFSIFTQDFEHCYVCHRQTKTDIHEIWGGSNRQRCMKYGLCIPLCRICHSNSTLINLLKREMQVEYEKIHTREEFIGIIGKSYL